MATKAVEVGGIECSARRRRLLAQRSRGFQCRGCGVDHSGFPGKIFEDLPALVEEEEREVVVSTAAGVVVGDGDEEGATTAGRRKRRGRIEGRGGGNSVVMAAEGGGSLLSVLYRHKLPVVLCMVFLLAFFLLNAPSGF